MLSPKAFLLKRFRKKNSKGYSDVLSTASHSSIETQHLVGSNTTQLFKTGSEIYLI